MKKVEEKGNIHNYINNMSGVFMMLYDVCAVNLSFFLALWLRFDGKYSAIPEEYLYTYLYFVPLYTVICIVIFKGLKLYDSLWRFASYRELARVTLASVITIFVQIIGTTVELNVLNIYKVGRMPLSYFVFGSLLQFGLVIIVRFSYRFVLLLRYERENKLMKDTDGATHVMLIGAGSAGQIILRDIYRASESKDVVCCIIDDDRNKWNKYLDGVEIYGGRESILEAVEKFSIDKIYVAIPSSAVEDRRTILNICKETGCELKNLPGMQQFINGEVSLRDMKEVSVEDLLGREPIKVDMDEIYASIEGKTILVTGGGGSIGSELCRQVASHNPKQLIIFDVYENNAYDIQQELKKKYPELNLVTLIGSVRDSRAIYGVFEKYKPNIVYHAAAHKHVPLMEDAPCEAIKNNALGTYKTAYAAMIHGCDRFVLISTDKAVNPTNIMGASKRLCEMIVQTFDGMIKAGKGAEIPELYVHQFPDDYETRKKERMPKEFKTEYVAVRFGNVLGSNGSVIPLFKKQIEAGGPVTVTHPDIIRYFMTIPEAVSLVMQAGTYAKGGEIFVLDMGSPVKIDDLARNLIKLTGHKPDVDIKVEYTGLRPGEKLYEEKLMAEEGLKTTPNKLIHIGCPIPFDIETFIEQLDGLLHAAYKNKEDMRERVREVVTTYNPG